jgi:hypothetical protein
VLAVLWHLAPVLPPCCCLAFTWVAQYMQAVCKEFGLLSFYCMWKVCLHHARVELLAVASVPNADPALTHAELAAGWPRCTNTLADCYMCTFQHHVASHKRGNVCLMWLFTTLTWRQVRSGPSSLLPAPGAASKPFAPWLCWVVGMAWAVSGSAVLAWFWQRPTWACAHESNAAVVADVAGAARGMIRVACWPNCSMCLQHGKHMWECGSQLT